MSRQTLEVGMRVYACIHPTATHCTPQHDRADQGTVIECVRTEDERARYKDQARAIVQWDTGEVDEHDALTGRCLDHPFTAVHVRRRK